MSKGRIVSVGARAALGLNALQIAMGVRAGLFEPRASGFKDARGQAIGLCRVGGLGADLQGYDRLLALATPALVEATAEQDLAGCSLVVALPAPGRQDDEPRFEGFADELVARAGLSFSQVAVVRRGNAGGIEALRVASEHLAAGAAGVVVGGVDSRHHADVLATLDEAFRLHALGVEDGFVPGEGAAFALLRPEPSPSDIAVLLDARMSSEPAMLDEERPNIAEGLTAAVRGVGGDEAPWVMTDVNPEHRRTREWGLIAVRHQLAKGEVTRLCTELGDLGAATVPMMLTVAATWWRRGCAPDRRLLLLGSSENDDRGAALLEGASS